MLSKKLEDAINDQINKELYSEYLYLSMSTYFFDRDLDGFANWFLIQAKEEHDHAMKFFNYVFERGGKVILKAIAQPDTEFKSIEDIFNKTLEHEKFVTASINNLVDIAQEEKDHASRSFLNWYVDEQVEEEDNASKLLNKVKLIKENTQGLFMLDKELSARVYVQPTQTK